MAKTTRVKQKPAEEAKPTLAAVRGALRGKIEPNRGVSSAWFFKTGPGEYAEGELFRWLLSKHQ